MMEEKECNVGDIKIGKIDLNQIWNNVDRPVYPAEKIYAVAEKADCTRCCPCRKYGEFSKRQLFRPAMYELASFRDREDPCPFYSLDLGGHDLKDESQRVSWAWVTQQCRLVELIDLLDLAYSEGSNIPSKEAK